MVEEIALGMTILGSVILALSLVKFYKLNRKIREVFRENGKNQYLPLLGYGFLMVFFLVGYLIMIVYLEQWHGRNAEVTIAFILLGGSLFVLYSLYMIQYMMDRIVVAKLNQTDPATGLYNKIVAKHAVERALKDSDIEKGLMMIDLDDFKSINDTYGHIEGDKLIVTIAQTLRNAVSGSDIVARFGGDEFVVLFECHNDKCLEEKKQAFLKKLNQLNYCVQGKTVKVNCSIGAVLLKPDKTFEQILEAADQQMYIEKHLKQMNQ